MIQLRITSSVVMSHACVSFGGPVLHRMCQALLNVDCKECFLESEIPYIYIKTEL